MKTSKSFFLFKREDINEEFITTFQINSHKENNQNNNKNKNIIKKFFKIKQK